MRLTVRIVAPMLPLATAGGGGIKGRKREGDSKQCNMRAYS
jgi:hypothetical protein